jgi:primosomal protein N' (replication factor Y)
MISTPFMADAIAPVEPFHEPSASYGTNEPLWVEVLVDCVGAQGLYLYRIPSHLSIQPGDILTVPFGNQQVGAIAIRRLETCPAGWEEGAIKPVEDVVSSGFFPPQYWTLVHRVANYYQCSLMAVIRTALPPGLLGRSQRRIRLIPDALPPGATEFLHPTAQQILVLLQRQKSGDYTWNYLQRQIRGASKGLRDLLKRGWVESYLAAPVTIRPKQHQVVTQLPVPPDYQPSDRQQEVLEVLKRRGGELPLQELLQICHVSSSVVKTLERNGCVVIHAQEVMRTGVAEAVSADTPKALTDAQAQALAAIAPLNTHRAILLHGVTGSGKTEVYLQAIAPVLEQGKSALVLVPEIGLTPQLTARFQARFGSRVRVYHSALSDGERYDTWRQMLDKQPQVVIGTRSAVFAPLHPIGLIVLDEEHDSSFKQDQPAPCYHARQVAQWRAELEDCPLILGSATPALETWAMVQPPMQAVETQNGAALYLSLPERIQARPMPHIDVVDMRQELHRGNRSIFSQSLQEALQDLKAKGEQAMLFIHRRGHSTFVSCRACGYVVECPHCDVSLSYHLTHQEGVQTLRCHYCGYGRSHPDNCPSCGSSYLKHFGSGTQRVMQELTHQFPDLRGLRYDSDTTRTKGSHHTLITQFAKGEADVLVGTQMITKGLDLPQVTLVGIVAADGLLHLGDYRANERAFQTLTQVAGRAGRGDRPGRVILQTYDPDHRVIRAVKGHEYESFAQQELQARADLHYPPCGQLILLRLSSPDLAAVQNTAEQLGDRLRPTDPDTVGYDVLGPSPAVVMRVAQRYRWQILIKIRPGYQPTLPDWDEVRSHCPPTVSLTIDVDPLTVL